MDRALKEIHVDYISTEQVKKLIEVCLTSQQLSYQYIRYTYKIYKLVKRVQVFFRIPGNRDWVPESSLGIVSKW